MQSFTFTVLKYFVLFHTVHSYTVPHCISSFHTAIFDEVETFHNSLPNARLVKIKKGKLK